VFAITDLSRPGLRVAVAAAWAGGVGAALEMVHGRHGDAARVGYLLSPPYFPLRVTQ
jgi:hypothetical protein